MKRLFNLIGLLALLILFVSCPATPPTVYPSGLEPSQAPSRPENVSVVSGLRDRIIISWDPVDLADSYNVYYVDASNPAGRENMLTSSAITGTRAVVSVSDNFGPDISSSTSYYFYVTAYKNINGNSYISAPSDYVEGTIAPHEEDIFFHGYIEGHYITAYWNCATLFSKTGSGDQLYDADFRVLLMAEGQDSWTALNRTEGAEGLWLSHSFDLNRYPQNSYLDIRIEATITATNGTVTTVTSPTFSILVSNDMSPSPVENVTITQGRAAEYVALEWTVPEWTGLDNVTRDNTFFKIERAISGTDDYAVLVDEITNITHYQNSGSGDTLELVDDTTRRYKFTDWRSEDPNDLQPGQRYVYRITNGMLSEDGTIIYMQSAADAVVSDEGYLFVTPNIISAEANVTFANTASASLNFEINYNTSIPVDLIWKIRRTITHIDSGNKDVDILNATLTEVPNTTDGTYSVTLSDFAETLDCADCINNTDHTYQYEALLVYVRAPEIVYTNQAQSTFKLIGTGNISADQTTMYLSSLPVIDTLSAVSRIGKIELQWTLAEGVTGTPTYRVIYDGVNTTLTDAGNETGHYASIDFADTAEHTFIVIAEVDGTNYRNARRATGAAYNFDDTFELDVVNNESNNSITVSWDGNYYTDSNISYGIEYREYGTDAYTELPDSIDITSGSAEITSLDLSGVYEFRFFFKDSNEVDSKAVSSDTAFYARVGNISATKGAVGSLTVTWDNVSNATSYEVYRYGGNESATDAVKIGEVTTTSYTDSTAEIGVKYYYLVKALFGERSASSMLCSFAASTQNQFGLSEAANLGYTYNSNAIDFTVSDANSPYFTVTFAAHETNSYYVLRADGLNGSKDSMVINLASLTTQIDNIWTNGVAENQIGYIALNIDTLEITANAYIGAVNLDGSFTGFDLQGFRSEGSSDSTVLSSHSVGHYRDLNAYEYLYIANTLLSEQLGRADSQFDSDWWPGTSSNVYNNGSFTINSSYGTGQSEGSIVANGFEKDGFVYNANISLRAADEGGWWNAGYLGTDPLRRIGNIDSNKTLTMSKTVNGVTLYASIDYNDIVFSYTSSGSRYTYTLNVEDKYYTVNGASISIKDSSIRKQIGVDWYE